jgi:hypothetical protein
MKALNRFGHFPGFRPGACGVAVGIACVSASLALAGTRSINALIIAPADVDDPTAASSPTDPLSVIKPTTLGATSNMIASVTGGVIGWESSGYNYTTTNSVLLTPNSSWVSGIASPPGTPVFTDTRIIQTTISHPSGITWLSNPGLQITVASSALSAGLFGLWTVRRRRTAPGN